MQQIPEEMILRLKEDKQIQQCARIEAEVTFLKMQAKSSADFEVLYAYPELVKDKHDLFTFSFFFGAHLANLQSGVTLVSDQVKDMFAARL